MSHRKYGLDHLGCRTARRLVSPALALWLCSQPFAARADLYFNPRFLADDPAAVADLSGFEKGQEVPPGTYRVDIYLNNGFMTTRDVTFQADAQGHGLSPCLTRGQLASMGVDTGRVPGMATLDSTACVPLTTLISEATTRFDVGQQRLYLTVPQAFMGNHARGYIPPELWDNGITAGLINYNFTGNNAHNTTGGSSRYAYLNLQSGLNIGAWRLRDNSTWSYSSGGSTSSNENRWQHVNSWLERDITPLRSRLTLGDSYTNGDVFDGINFRGAQLASDDNMLPDSQKGFAPVIHGIARGTAQVSIRQNGYEIYQSTVPPGPFTIDDLYAAGNGGDLQVTIKEADGSRQVFSVPWSTVPVLQREGHTRFALTAGEYRSGNSQQETPDFFQGTAMHGLPAGWTLYGGTQLADRYRAFNLGVGKNMGYFGALSLDITQANATLADDSEHQGQSVRFLYNKSLDETGTNLQLVGYRYSTRGYYNFADTTYRRMSGYSVETQDGGGNGDNGSTGYTALNYRGGYGNANVGYSRSDGFKQLYYGVSGGVLAHANGITLSQPLNDTVVLVKAPGAGGVKVENQTGVRTDWRGYAVLPYATEYRENRIALDTNTLADNVDLDDAVVSVVPTHGAIVRANFNAQVGMKILMTLTHRGKPVPFGALATGDSNQSGSIVADNGQVYLSGMPLAGKVRVKWGDGPDAQCVADYRLPPESQQQALSQLSVACR